MAKILDMPKLSPTMEEGQIGSWSKKEGDAVAVDNLLAEVETDKATMEFRSFDQGTLLKILAPAGSIVKLGQPVAILGQAGEDVSALLAKAGGSAAEGSESPPPAAPAASPPAAAAPAPTPAAPTEGAPQQSATAAQTAPAKATPTKQSPAPEIPPREAAAPPSADGRVKASPYVRKMARERDVSLVGVSGSGPNGRIVARDLEGIVAAQARGGATQKNGPLAEPEVRPLSMMRKTIARRLTESKQTVPHFYLTIDVDADALVSLRERVNADLAASSEEHAPKVSLNDLVLKAVALGLVRVPTCNAQFTPDAILIHRRVDISVAVAVDDGLVTPVVRDADKKSVLQIADEVRELAGRAKQKKLRPEEMQNGTFSVSNLGMFGIDSFSAVINPPEGAILSIGQVRKEPVVRGDSVVPGKKLSMTLACDHRVIDGAIGATFLKALRSLIEHPSQLLLY